MRAQVAAAILALWCSSSSSQPPPATVEPRWLWVDVRTSAAAFIDTATLQRNGPLRDFWIMYVRSEISPRGEVYDQTHYVMNCEARTVQILASASFNATYAIVHHAYIPAPTAPESLMPESHGERVFQYVCDAPGAQDRAFPAYQGPRVAGRHIFALHRAGLDYALASVLACWVGKPRWSANTFIDQNVALAARPAVRRILGLSGREP